MLYLKNFEQLTMNFKVFNKFVQCLISTIDLKQIKVGYLRLKYLIFFQLGFVKINQTTFPSSFIFEIFDVIYLSFEFFKYKI